MGRRVQLAPLDPDGLLRWAWEQVGRQYGTFPVTFEDVWFEWERSAGEYTREMLRRDYVRLAAKVRRNQRLGRDPWADIDGVWTGWRK